MQRTCFKFYWDFARQDPSSGVKTYQKREYFDSDTKISELWYRDLLPGFSLEAKSIEEARAITKSRVIINASVVGAGLLAGDEAVLPVRGQTMFVKTGFSELIMLEGSEYTYIIPGSGSGGVIIGGIRSDRLDAEVDVSPKSDILRRVNHLSKGAFQGLDLDSVTDWIGFRPGRKSGLRVEREGDVIHAYGLESAVSCSLPTNHIDDNPLPALDLQFKSPKGRFFATLSRPSAMSSKASPKARVPPPETKPERRLTRTRSGHTSDSSLFCCTKCYVLSDPRGPVEKEIFRFGFCMANLTSSPSGCRYLPSALSHILERAPYIVRYERWLHAEKDVTRYFMPHPRIKMAFVELSGLMVAESEKEGRWVPNRGYLKFRCDEHTGPWLTCFLLQRGLEVLSTVPLTEYEPKKGKQKSVGEVCEQHDEDGYLEQGDGKKEVVGIGYDGIGLPKAELVECPHINQRERKPEEKGIFRRSLEPGLAPPIAFESYFIASSGQTLGTRGNLQCDTLE
ncbi:FAD dependent oxidoreductase [Diplocarpon mali]|nr:FAD dependent oxidoreductase [Diplocarpon mali]